MSTARRTADGARHRRGGRAGRSRRARRGGAGSRGRTGRCRVLAASASGSPRSGRSTGCRIAACLHVTAETAVLVRALRAGGAEVALAASNPLSTQDDIAAALGADVRHRGLRPGRGGPATTYYRHIDAGARPAGRPDLVLDDGGDLVNTLHTERTDAARPACAAAARRPRRACSGCAGWRPTRALRLPGRRGRATPGHQADVRQHATAPASRCSTG